jgi:hypothetical protein
MNHHTTPDFWECYNALPSNVQAIADRAFAHLKENPQHPSLHLKQIGEFWSVRAGIHYRALAIEMEDGYLWFWIGTHADYDKLIA